MENKRRRFHFSFRFIPVIVIAAILLLSAVVMFIWNSVITDILGVKAITYGQAIGLFVLCKILFSSFRPGPPGGFRRGGPPWRNKLMNLSPEEREKFKQEWQRHATGKEPGEE